MKRLSALAAAAVVAGCGSGARIDHPAPPPTPIARMTSVLVTVVDGNTQARVRGALVKVGGRTARYGDEASRIASRIPLFAAAVVGLSLLLLLAAFRSWRISVLSAVFNLASIAAAYGVVALAFQTSAG